MQVSCFLPKDWRKIKVLQTAELFVVNYYFKYILAEQSAVLWTVVNWHLITCICLSVCSAKLLKKFWWSRQYQRCLKELEETSDDFGEKGKGQKNQTRQYRWYYRQRKVSRMLCCSMCLQQLRLFCLCRPRYTLASLTVLCSSSCPGLLSLQNLVSSIF